MMSIHEYLYIWNTIIVLKITQIIYHDKEDAFHITNVYINFSYLKQIYHKRYDSKFIKFDDEPVNLMENKIRN